MILDIANDANYDYIDASTIEYNALARTAANTSALFSNCECTSMKQRLLVERCCLNDVK